MSNPSPRKLNVFQQAICPEMPKLNDPLQATLKPGAVFKIEPTAGYYNNVHVKCEPCNAENTAAAATKEGFLGFEGGLFQDPFLLFLVLGLIYYVVNDTNPL